MRIACDLLSALLRVLLAAVCGVGWVCAQPLAPFKVEAGEIRAPLGGLKGDAARGRAVFLARESNCALCHVLPDGDPRLMGNIGPPLGGVAARFTPGELRLRIVDSIRINPQTTMPSYYRIDGLTRVAPSYAGKPVFTAQEVEDVVAFLSTLR
jgi:L-cysteine S-thiosulfotransferase